VPEVSHLARPPSGDEPLTPDEVAEMKQHVAFIRRYREVLRLKLNAAEDLLVNGQREPGDRGVCRHLLGKVDRAVIESAIEREPLRSDPAARARMLAGAVRVTADLGVLLAYLESLAHVRSRAEAAAAFAEVVRRLDFESLSATRLARLLQVLLAAFVDHERVQVVLGLLASGPFRRAFDAAAATFPADIAGVFTPLRAVHRHVTEGGGADDPSLLAAGLEQILAAPDPVLRAHAEPLRVGMLELALGPGVPAPLADRAVGVLLPSLPRGERTYARLVVRRASQLLARHADDRARAVLEELRRAQPSHRTAERWLAALDAPRVGRVALAGEHGHGRLAAAFWLDAQQPLWLRTATAPSAERLANEARLQAGLGVPGVAVVVDAGVASGIPYVAVAAPGRPFAPASQPRDAAVALGLAASAARILCAVALGGVRVPDAAPERFVALAPPAIALMLADFDGATPAEPQEALAAHAGAAATFTGTLLPDDVIARLPADVGNRLRRALAEPRDPIALIGALDRAMLHVRQP